MIDLPQTTSPCSLAAPAAAGVQPSDGPQAAATAHHPAAARMERAVPAS
jgi:hypothetical protein